MTRFKREPRYVVFKLKDIHAFLSAAQIEALQTAGETIAAGRARAGKPPFIEARMRGQGMSTAVVLAKLRQYADIADAGDKPHWAKTMRDAATLVSEQQWRPIETAPKDGSHVQLFRPEIQFVGYYGGAESGWRINAPGVPAMWPEPTHWAPLRKAPPVSDLLRALNQVASGTP